MIFCHGRFCDIAFMERIRPLLQSFAFTNIAMQSFFREWARHAGEEPAPTPAGFVDYAEIPFLAELNRALSCDCDDASLAAQLERNLALAKELRCEIVAEAARLHPGIVQDVEAPSTTHLDHVFAGMRGEAEPS